MDLSRKNGGFTERAHGFTRRDFLKLSAVAGLGIAGSSFLYPKDKAHAAGVVKTRFLVGSDVHIPNHNSPEKLPRVLSWAGGQLSPAVDRICLVGDLVDNGTVDQYQQLAGIINASPFALGTGVSDSDFVFCQGNHETYSPGVANAPARFKECLFQDANKVLAVNGVPIITMGPNGSSDQDYTKNYAFLKTALETVTSDTVTYGAGSPILLLCHHSIPDTAYTSEEWCGSYSGEELALMKRYPQIIHISGHSHATVEDARSIDQSMGITCIQDSTLGAYFENERNTPNTMYDPSTGGVSSYPAYNGEASQCLILDVMDDGTVEVTRYNLYPLLSGAAPYQIYETWIIDVPAMIAAGGTASSCRYLPTRAASMAPVLPTTGGVEIKDAAQDGFTVTFPSFTAGSSANLDMVHAYRIVLTPVDANGQKIGDPSERRIFNDYYRASSSRHETTGERWTVKVAGLAAGASYRVEVNAETSFFNNANGESVSLPAVVGTTTEAPAAPAVILDVDYRTGGVEDAMGHEATKWGAALADDEGLASGMTAKVLEIDGNGGYGYLLNAEDFGYFAGQSTTECLFKMVDVKSDQCVLSNQQQAGAGFEVENGMLEYWFNHAGGSKVMPAAAIEANAWVHAMATFDGNSVKLYVDGVLADAKETGNKAMTVPNPKTYFVGADTSSAGTPEYKCKNGTRVALARIYPRCLSAEEVASSFASAFVLTKTVVDAQTGIKVEGVGLDQKLVAEGTLDRPKAILGENDVLIASFDIALESSEAQLSQPVTALTLTLPVTAGWAAKKVRVEIAHGDDTSETRADLAVSEGDAVIVTQVSKLSQFDVIATKDPSDGGGSGGNDDGGSNGGGSQGGSDDGGSKGGSAADGNNADSRSNGSSGSRKGGSKLVQTGDAPWAAAAAAAVGVAGTAAVLARAALTGDGAEQE